MSRRLTVTDYQRLLEFRVSLRRFLHWSEEQARAQGLTAAQHQLLLSIKGHPGGNGPSIGDIAESLLLRHHSAVGLIDRAEAKGLIKRTPDPGDRRTIRLTLTEDAERRLEALSELHLAEMPRLAGVMRGSLAEIPDPRGEDSPAADGGN